MSEQPTQVVWTLMMPPTLEQAFGQRVGTIVRTDEGLIIAAPGQIVTERVIERARTYHKENELIDAAGLGATASGAQATQSIQDSAQQFKETTSSLWDRLKGSLSATQERAAQEAEERRTRYALGRPTNRVILDPADNVILNVGELITHQAIERAKDRRCTRHAPRFGV